MTEIKLETCYTVAGAFFKHFEGIFRSSGWYAFLPSPGRPPFQVQGVTIPGRMEIPSLGSAEDFYKKT